MPNAIVSIAGSEAGPTRFMLCQPQVEEENLERVPDELWLHFVSSDNAGVGHAFHLMNDGLVRPPFDLSMSRNGTRGGCR